MRKSLKKEGYFLVTLPFAKDSFIRRNKKTGKQLHTTYTQEMIDNIFKIKKQDFFIRSSENKKIWEPTTRENASKYGNINDVVTCLIAK